MAPTPAPGGLPPAGDLFSQMQPMLQNPAMAQLVSNPDLVRSMMSNPMVQQAMQDPTVRSAAGFGCLAHPPNHQMMAAAMQYAGASNPAMAQMMSNPAVHCFSFDDDYFDGFNVLTLANNIVCANGQPDGR
jgi:hypothetical protein